MADYPGEVLMGPPDVLPLPNLTPNVPYSFEPIRGLSLIDSLTGRTDAPAFTDRDALISPEPCRSLAADPLGCFEELFEKIIILPRAKHCGFILSNVIWQTNVWNTHRNQVAALVRCDPQDGGHVRLTDPPSYPLLFYPLAGWDFETVAEQGGSAALRVSLDFEFPGEDGTDLLVTGSRIELFSAEPDWSEPIRERTQYLTDILQGYTGKEQRIALRNRPRTYLAFRVMPADRRGSAALEALVYGHQARVFGVPFWPDAQKITAPSLAGSSLVYCDTSNRKFRAGGILVLWRGFFTHEAIAISSVAAGNVTLTDALIHSWAADGLTYAIPVLTGRWDGEAGFGRLSPSSNELDAQFQCDPDDDVAPATPGQVYGFDVLEIEPNAVQDRVMPYSRTVSTLDCGTGAARAIDRSGVAVGQPGGFLWTLLGRAEIAAYRAWLARRKGRQSSFWLPTWQHDLVQSGTLGAGVVNLVVHRTGYTKYQLPNRARRHLCFTMLDGSGAKLYRRVMEAYEADMTETLVLDSPLSSSAAVPAGSCMISFLQLVRLSTDEPELVWSSRDVAEVQLDCVEVPLEVTL